MRTILFTLAISSVALYSCQSGGEKKVIPEIDTIKNAGPEPEEMEASNPISADTTANISTQKEIKKEVLPTQTISPQKTSEKPSGKVQMLTKQEFLNQVMDYEKNPEVWNYKGKLPCIIDFYADWCRPCRITAPILDELAVEYAGKINIYKIDTMQEKELAASFGIQGLPTFLFCPMEGNPQMTSGIANTPEATKLMFKQYIESILLKNTAI